jgi:hypothetical protein
VVRGQEYSFGRDRERFARIAPALRFIAKRLLLSRVPAVSSAARKYALDSIMSDLCADLSSDMPGGINAVAERGDLPDMSADGHVELWERLPCIKKIT